MTAATGTAIGSVAPVFCVTDMQAAMGYLGECLGFAEVGRAGDPPVWASYVRGRIEVMLVCGDYPTAAQDWVAYFYVDDVDALYTEFQTRGARIKGPPVNKPYNNREIEVQMPDGRVLAFGGPIPERKQT